jgi:hypothetical protein
MKQTTLTIRLIEHIAHLELEASCRGNPTEKHQEMWRIITNRPDAMVGVPEPINPKGAHSLEWEKATRERLGRIMRDRKLQTKVVPLTTCPDGTEFEWKVTLFWEHPKQSPIDKTLDQPGYWELFEVTHGGKRRKHYNIDATIDCLGDELYDHLPDGMCADNFEVMPDIGSVWLMPRTDELNSFEFRFHKTRH